MWVEVSDSGLSLVCREGGSAAARKAVWDRDRWWACWCVWLVSRRVGPNQSLQQTPPSGWFWYYPSVALIASDVGAGLLSLYVRQCEAWDTACDSGLSLAGREVGFTMTRRAVWGRGG